MRQRWRIWPGSARRSGSGTGASRRRWGHYRRTGLQPVDTYARAAFDAMEALIRDDERAKIDDGGGEER